MIFNFKQVGLSCIHIVLLLLFAATAYPANTFENSFADVADLISQLDSERYESRESATNTLVVIGESALEPLAFHFYQASPEAAWRIKRVFHEIGTNSKEEITSLKAIGLLMLLDHQLDSELSVMLETWRKNRSLRAIEHMVNKGAKLVTNPRANRLGPQIVFGNSTVRTNRAINPLRTSKRKKLAWPDAKKKIEKVVNGQLDDVQEIVFENLPSQQRQRDDLLVEDFPFGRPGAFPANHSSTAKTSLEIGKQFRGGLEDLNRLKEVHSLLSLKFTDQLIDKKQVDLIRSLSGLQHLGFENTKVKGGHLFDIELPPSVNSIELKNQSLESATVSWLASIPLRNLSLERCKISVSAFDELPGLNQLQFMKLQRLSLSRRFFANLADMPTVREVSISVCQFDAEDYRNYAKLRPRKTITFNPVSFLGVQGTPSLRQPGQFSCKIEQVVSGSGAEAAGVQAGDIVEAVNGAKINNFDELRMFISQLDVGEKMTLQVDRDGQQLELSAILGVNENQIR